MRLNRYLASAGFGSRRGCEELIRTARVTINGQVCTNLATEVSDDDFVKVNGKRAVAEKLLYVLINKPRGYLCTAADTHERRTIFDLLPRGWPRIFHVGRLDKESEGLLILTNDGELSLHLTHPRFKIEKEYEVLLDRPLEGEAREKLLKGVRIEGGRAKAELVRVISPTVIRVVLKQGLKRQIRLMFRALGYEVKELVRFRIGSLHLGEMRPGEWRFLTAKEVAALKSPARETAGRAPRRPVDSSAHRSSR